MKQNEMMVIVVMNNLEFWLDLYIFCMYAGKCNIIESILRWTLTQFIVEKAELL
jgi:hypothetical protein